LKDENGRLYKLLGERDEEMRILRKARGEEKRALAGEIKYVHIYSDMCLNVYLAIFTSQRGVSYQVGY